MFLNYKKIYKCFNGFFLIITMFLASSCVSKVEPIEERAAKRWNALVSSDFDTAYKFESPNYRETYSLDRFKTGFGGTVKWNSAKVDDVEKLNENLADVSILIEVDFEGTSIETIIKERWVLKDNQWWHVLK